MALCRDGEESGRKVRSHKCCFQLDDLPCQKLCEQRGQSCVGYEWSLGMTSGKCVSPLRPQDSTPLFLRPCVEYVARHCPRTAAHSQAKCSTLTCVQVNLASRS